MNVSSAATNGQSDAAHGSDATLRDANVIMRIPVEVMRRLLELEQAAIEAVRRRNEAVALVLATLGAPTDAQIILLPDGSGEILESNNAHHHVVDDEMAD